MADRLAGAISLGWLVISFGQEEGERSGSDGTELHGDLYGSLVPARDMSAEAPPRRREAEYPVPPRRDRREAGGPSTTRRDGREAEKWRELRRAPLPLGLLLPRRGVGAGGAGTGGGASWAIPALALTDHDGVWGAMEFAQACKAFGVRPIVGAELTVTAEAAPST